MSYSKEIRQEVCQLREKGYSCQWISNHTGVSPNTVRYWVKHIVLDNPSVAWKMSYTYAPIAELTSKQQIRKRLIEDRGHRCENCKLTKWLGQPIMLEVHNHKVPDQRKLLCPNCHSQTGDWRKKQSRREMAQQQS